MASAALTTDARFEIYDDDAADASATRDARVMVVFADSMPRLGDGLQLVVVDECVTVREGATRAGDQPARPPAWWDAVRAVANASPSVVVVDADAGIRERISCATVEHDVDAPPTGTAEWGTKRCAAEGEYARR